MVYLSTKPPGTANQDLTERGRSGLAYEIEISNTSTPEPRISAFGSSVQTTFASPEFELLEARFNLALDTDTIRVEDLPNWYSKAIFPNFEELVPENDAKKTILDILIDPQTSIDYVLDFLIKYTLNDKSISDYNFNDEDIQTIFSARSSEKFDLKLIQEHYNRTQDTIVNYKNLNLEIAFPITHKRLQSPANKQDLLNSVSHISAPPEFGYVSPNPEQIKKLSAKNSINENSLFNQQLIDDAQSIAKSYDDLSCSKKSEEENLSEYTKKLLKNILRQQKFFIANINQGYKETSGNKYVDFLASDRDNSSNIGDSVYTTEAKANFKYNPETENINQQEHYKWQNIAFEKRPYFLNQLESDHYMNEIHQKLLERGIPAHMVSGALFEEALARIEGGSYAPPFLSLATGTEEYIRTNPGDAFDPEYEKNEKYSEAIKNYLAGNNIKYSKEETITAINGFEESQQNQLIRDKKLKFQTNMDIPSGPSAHEFITSLHVEDSTLSQAKELATSLQRYLKRQNIDCSIRVGVDAEGDANKSNTGEETLHFINIMPGNDNFEFDGKKFYLEFASQRIKEASLDILEERGIVSEETARLTRERADYHNIITPSFGFADSSNDIPSIVSTKNVPGLTVVVANAKNLNHEGSDFMKKINPIEWNHKNKIMQYISTYSPAKIDEFEEIVARLYQVDQNKSRYVYLADPNGNEELNKGVNSGLLLLSALKECSLLKDPLKNV
ncbi:MAG: hypothetical protein MK033_08220 [Candidatus Caenarcaniphilales bacterium]|nr:hypothetical protein [Candidatus Caenarcaniphilales bacterium]